MNILCIESATEQCSVALLSNGEIDCSEQLAPRKHNELILELSTQLLDQKGITHEQLDAIAFGRGPGAFTGVRIAASVAQGVSLALEIPVIAVSTLDILAQKILDQNAVDYAVPIMDARMNEVYWTVCGRDDEGLAVRVTEERVCAPDKVHFNFQGKCAGIGSGWLHYPEISELLTAVRIDVDNAAALPSAVQLAKLARREWLNRNFVSAEQAIPVYIRDNVVSGVKS